jgi:hypothetical protein
MIISIIAIICVIALIVKFPNLCAAIVGPVAITGVGFIFGAFAFFIMAGLFPALLSMPWFIAFVLTGIVLTYRSLWK